MAITTVSFKKFFVGNLGVIPDSIIYSFLGVSLGTLSDIEDANVEDNATLFAVWMSVMLTALFLLIVAIGLATKKVKKMIAEGKEKLNEKNGKNNISLDMKKIDDMSVSKRSQSGAVTPVNGEHSQSAPEPSGPEQGGPDKPQMSKLATLSVGDNQVRVDESQV